MKMDFIRIKHLLLFAVVSLLFACGGSESTSPQDEVSPPPVQEILVESKIWRDYKSLATDPSYAAIHEAAALLNYSKVGFEYGQKLAPDYKSLSHNANIIMSSPCEETGIVIEGVDLPIYNAACFGMIPDDELDDGVAFQKAINKIESNATGGILFISKGIYDFRKEVDYDGIDIETSNFYVVGETIEGKLLTSFNVHATAKYGNKIPWGEFFLIQYSSNQPRELIHEFQGFQYRLKEALLDSLQHPIEDYLQVGDFVSTSLYNNQGSEVTPHLTNPILEAATEWRNFNRNEPYRFVSQVVGQGEFTSLLHGAPIEIPFDSNIRGAYYKEAFIENVGMQYIKFTSTWDGGYCHHGSCGEFDSKEIFDMDYGWAALRLSGVANAAFHNISFEDFTFPFEVVNSTAVTASKLKFDGHFAHHAVILKGWHNLVTDVTISNRTTHALTTNEFSVGNVFHNIKNSSGDALRIDFHAKQPAIKNLFDSIQNAYVEGAGNEEDMPHSGQGNVLWNISADSSILGSIDNQIFYSWVANKYDNADEAYKLFPASLIVNYYSLNGDLKIGEFSSDFSDEWIYAEGLNVKDKLLEPESLFCAQLKLVNSTNTDIYCED